MAGTLYFVRHGQTLFNTRGIIQGWIDSPLTPKGEAEADRVGRYFRHEGIVFDHAYASTLARTHATIERITNMPYGREAGLREWSFGEFEGERIALMPTWPWGDFFQHFGGEGQLEFRARILNTVRAIMQRPQHCSVLAVSHGSSSRELIVAIRDGGVIDSYRKPPGNCSICRYAFDGSEFSLEDVIEQDDMCRILGE